MNKQRGKIFAVVVFAFLIMVTGITVVNIRVTRNLSQSYEYDGLKVYLEKDPFTFAVDFGDYYFKFDGSGITKITRDIVNVFNRD
ncbi:hypothetical protein SAMN02745196_02392 [Clostridium collagenovorans DSM 3089]|uniref:Uncharacterized protein n=1 Tax=Clostridium collagenovorans DSM 3089 TaxID=1121306 RepID=A0A1M5XRC1_9CLOT|nr:hypothetical protein [Clostridium collagenovorans]SHI02094.1 hypothetical protein SAMN02745196_02392 [Clostridium collagenovorans DSM 3089]